MHLKYIFLKVSSFALYFYICVFNFLQNIHIFKNLSSPLAVARYHSLIAIKIPDELEVIAEVNDLVMAVVDDKNKICGLQFHPELPFS